MTFGNLSKNFRGALKLILKEKSARGVFTLRHGNAARCNGLLALPPPLN
jgi:hypothetical protein